MKKSILPFLFLAISLHLSAQKLVSQNTYVLFFSETPIEDIEASLNDGVGIVNAETKDFAFQVNIQSFTFDKALMQEHFNENYMESTAYPKAFYKGKITGEVSWSKPGSYAVQMVGKMTIHGKEQSFTTPAKISISKEGLVVLESNFIVRPEEFDIEIPSLVITKIAKEIEVKVKSTLRAS